ncbi:MAG: metallophosphoesterase, partial [Prevotella sp.]|nr:metallophosphoesterase [Prevotella sp.]
MIARIVILLVLVLLLPQLYFDRRKLRRRKMWQRLLRWLPTVAMMVLTVALAMERDFVPHEMTVMNIYLMLLGLIFAPKAIYVLCSLAGRFVRKIRHSRYNWGNLVGFFLAFFIVFVVLYGSFVGVRRLNVNRMEIALKDLSEAFDGYRIVLFSDAHVGSFTGWRQSLLQRDIDSINAQQADAIFFVGDLQ